MLPPRSPKLHGAVERANPTHTEEVYEITDAEPTLAALGVELRAWEHTYNFIVRTRLWVTSHRAGCLVSVDIKV